MRGNGWQITAIISIILVILLIIPIVMLTRDRQNLVDQRTGAEAARTEAAQKASQLEGDVQALKALIGDPATETAELTAAHKSLMDKAMPNENEAVQTYHAAVEILLGDLGKAREDNNQVTQERNQMESELNAEQGKYQTALLQMENSWKDAEDRLKVIDQKVQDDREENARKYDDALKKQEKTLADKDKEISDLTEQLRLKNNENLDFRDVNAELLRQLGDVRNPNVEYPAGKILSVNQQAGLATINLGHADGLYVRTMFSVYHSSITGLTFRTVSTDHDPVYCDVCKRELARDTSKARVEVMRILGPHRAEVRILDDILTDPIMTGDVVFSPIWRPGQHLRFALGAGLSLPGSVEGSAAVKRLIESNGGKVDCWLNEAGDEETGYIEGEMSAATNFLVIDENMTRNLNNEIDNLQEALKERAGILAIKVITLGDLLSRMGWKNVTPVYTFGSKTFTPETRVTPHTQSSIRSSGGHVAPMFTPDNPGARVSALEATPVRSSGSTVSPLFSDKAPAPPSGNGKTSDLFRERKPTPGK